MERQELRDMIETIDDEENSKLKKMKDDFESLREETKNKNVEELESMKHDLIKKIEDLDKEFEVNFNRYVSETETKAEYYKKLLEDNEKSSQQINNYQRQINRLKEQIAYWSLKMKQTERECQERNQKLKKEKERPKFGTQLDIQRIEFEVQVTRAPAESVVIITLYQNYNPESVKLV
jgi:chromosome segregation ATPase